MAGPGIAGGAGGIGRSSIGGGGGGGGGAEAADDVWVDCDVPLTVRFRRRRALRFADSDMVRGGCSSMAHEMQGAAVG